ncbi:MAG: metal ABC transporter permease [Chloroflexi bacterium]|nr:metal ABC transporter permease [Chloroflexota bacterium]
MLEYDFMVRALVGGTLVGATAPSLGLFLVLRRLSLIADTLSHVALMGVAIALITHAMPTVVSLAATTAGAVAIEQLRLRRLMPSDAAMAVFLYIALAVAVVIISMARGFNVGLFSFLFGSVLTITPLDIWLAAGLAVVVLGYITMFYSELSQSSFDTDLARTTGVPVNSTSIALAILTGAVITLSMRIVGVLLVGALIVIPVMISLRLARGLRTALLLAMGLGVTSVLIGLTIAFYADLAAGGAIVLTAGAMLLLSEVGSLAARRLFHAH